MYTYRKHKLVYCGLPQTHNFYMYDEVLVKPDTSLLMSPLSPNITAMLL